MKKFYVLLIAIYSVSLLYGQNNPTVRIGVEVGNGVVDGKIKDTWNIRQNVNFYDYGYDYSGRRPYSDNSFLPSSKYIYLGIKPQISFFKDRINIFSGLRFTMFNNRIGGSNSEEPIFLRVNNPNSIDFYKITSISEKTEYLSVPLEVSYRLFQSHIVREYPAISGYFKIGGEVGAKVYGKQKLEFESPKMLMYEDEILKSNGAKENSFYATLYTSLGLQLSTRNGMQYSIEAMLPSKIRSNDNFSLLTSGTFSGFQFSVQTPINIIF